MLQAEPVSADEIKSLPYTLTPEDVAKLEKDQNLVSEFKRNKFEKEACKNWDLFYKRNTTKFFKDRHWTTREFQELLNEPDSKKVALEVGCGVGNFLFPLLEETGLFFYACDFSKRAVDFVKQNDNYDEKRCNAFVCDITKDDLVNNVPAQSVDIVSLIFVLSSIHPDNMLSCLHNIKKVIKPGGCLLFRDYGLHDYAMLRFSPGHKLAENFYVRQDGTRAYYFSTEVIERLVCEAGYEVSHLDYVKRETVNKKEGLCVPRIFVQGKFTVPLTS
ncbi:methyltransferase-like protein 6 isoform X2 [Argonauta hians]